MVPVQFERLKACADLTQRCEALGLSMLHMDASGHDMTVQSCGTSAIDRTMIESPLFRSALQHQTQQWQQQDDPTIAQLWPGCWAIPLPIHQRRRCVGYNVIIMPAVEMVESEQFHTLCNLTGIDRQVAAGRFRRTAAGSAEEIKRTSNLLTWMADDLKNIQQNSCELDNMSNKLGGSYEELSLIYKLSAHMLVTQDPYRFLEDACIELKHVVGLRWIALQMTDDSDVPLTDMVGRLIVSDKSEVDETAMQAIAKQLMQRFAKSDTVVINHAAELGIESLTHFAEQLLIVPIVAQGRLVAMLIGADKIDGSELSTTDSKLVTAAAQNMTIFLENAILYEDMQDMFMGMLRSLVAAIDAKDAYTCGHSERVAWLGRQLAEASGLDAATVERVYLSGLVHDVGKIGVPETVLTKPGRLTKEEYDIIKMHPDIGVKILKDISQMQDLLPGVHHHHERWDGNGYPYGLKGQDIPLFGRLIALADSFDAMSSTRTYRKRMLLEEALQEIRDCTGEQFDPDLAEVFLSLDFSQYDQMVKNSQNGNMRMNKVLETSS